MRRFHAPTDDKRSVVILDPSHYDSWLRSTPEQATSLLTLYPAELMCAESAPRPVNQKLPVPVPKAKQPHLLQSHSLSGCIARS